MDKYLEYFSGVIEQIYDEILYWTLKISTYITDYCSTQVSSKKLLEIRELTQHMDKVL